MKLLNQQVKAADVLGMIDMRLESLTNNYRYAVNGDRKIEAEAMAEAKWQLAELKMQFVDLLLAQINEHMNQDC